MPTIATSKIPSGGRSHLDAPCPQCSGKLLNRSFGDRPGVVVCSVCGWRGEWKRTEKPEDMEADGAVAHFAGVTSFHPAAGLLAVVHNQTQEWRKCLLEELDTESRWTPNEVMILAAWHMAKQDHPEAEVDELFKSLKAHALRLLDNNGAALAALGGVVRQNLLYPKTPGEMWLREAFRYV